MPEGNGRPKYRALRPVSVHGGQGEEGRRRLSSRRRKSTLNFIVRDFGSLTRMTFQFRRGKVKVKQLKPFFGLQ